MVFFRRKRISYVENEEVVRLKRFLADSYLLTKSLKDVLSDIREKRGKLPDERFYMAIERLEDLQNNIARVKDSDMLLGAITQTKIREHRAKIARLSDELSSILQAYRKLRLDEHLQNIMKNTAYDEALRSEDETFREAAMATADLTARSATEKAIARKVVEDKYILTDDFLKKLDEYISTHKELFKLLEKR